MRVLMVLLILMIVSLSFGQTTIFKNKLDTVNVDSGSTYTSRTIIFNAYPEGVGTLFMAGDSSSGVPLGVTGTWQIYYGKNAENDSLWGVATAFSDSVLVKGDLDNAEYDTGDLTGRETDLGAIPWKLGLGVKFVFVPHYTGWMLGRLLFF
jgi:hypothetical protein